MSRATTKAALRINEQLRGQKNNFRVVGCLLFKERDATDGQWYYWEEWELTGFSDYDCWVEYDHDTKQVSLYEPVRFTERIDPEKLQAGAVMQLTDETGVARQVTVDEVGRGTIAELKGKNAYQVFVGEEMVYATLASQAADGTKQLLTLEKYNNREYDIYRKTLLSVEQQRQLFGKRITPLTGSTPRGAIVYLIIVALIIVVSILTSGDDEYSGTGGTRSVYGGGSGGFGK